MTQAAEKETGTSLALLPELKKETALVAFSTDKGLDPFLEKMAAAAREKAAAHDISTPAGRAAIISIAFDVAKEKTKLERLKKDLTAEARATVDRINDEGGRAWDALEALQKEIRKPVTEWEEADKKRVAALEEGVRLIASLAEFLPGEEPTAAEIAERIAAASVSPVVNWQEFEARFKSTKENTIRTLSLRYAAREKYETEQEELKLLREQKEARDKADREAEIARQADEKARREEQERAAAELALEQAWAAAHLENAAFDRAAAERKAEEEKKALQKAKDEQEAAAKKAADIAAQKIADEQEARRKLEEKAEKDRLKAAEDAKAAEKKAADDLKAAQDKAEKDKQAAAAKAEKEKADAVAAEKARVAKAKADEDEETRKREQNLAHKKKINNEAMTAAFEALSQGSAGSVAGGILTSQAKAIITAIASGHIPHVTIKY